MSFIIGHQEPYGAAILLYFSGGLCSKKRRPSAGFFYITISPPPQVRAVTFSILKEGCKITDPHYIQCASYLIIIMKSAGKRHISAITAAGDHDPRGIKV